MTFEMLQSFLLKLWDEGELIASTPTEKGDAFLYSFQEKYYLAEFTEENLKSIKEIDRHMAEELFPENVRLMILKKQA